MSRPTLDDLKRQRDGHLTYGARPGRALTPKPDPLDYVGVDVYGKTVAWMSGSLTYAHRRPILREWDRDGLDVERCTTEEAKRRLHAADCPCGAMPGECCAAVASTEMAGGAA